MRPSRKEINVVSSSSSWNRHVFALFFCFGIQGVMAAPEDHFVTTWETFNTIIAIPMIGGPFDVDWDNDGNFDEFGLFGGVYHDFGVPGIYTIRIRGNYNSIRTTTRAHRDGLLFVNQWGTNLWTTMYHAFRGSRNFQVIATDTPNFSLVTDMSGMFDATVNLTILDTTNWDTSAVTNMYQMFSQSSVNPDTSNWDTSAVTNMGSMFSSSWEANPDTSNWDVSAVTNMASMFANTTSANPNTSNWDTSSVTDMREVFHRATAANPDTSNWDMSSVTRMNFMFSYTIVANPNTSSWDISSVTEMSRMFMSAAVANPDTSNWDTSAVISIESMFRYAVSATPVTKNWNTKSLTGATGTFWGASSANPDVSNWDTSAFISTRNMFRDATSFDRDLGLWDVRSLVDAQDMFTGVTLSSPNYDSLLTNWSSQAVLTDVVFHVGSSIYCSSAAISARAHLITSESWKISDGGRGCFVTPGAPIIAPDLTPSTDKGISDSDDITYQRYPELYVACSEISNSINLYTDFPSTNTLIGSSECTTIGIEVASVTSALEDGIHNVSYTDIAGNFESEHSPSLKVTIIPKQVLPSDDFVTTWNTNNPGTSNATSITVPMIGGPYDVDWNNDGVFDQVDLFGSVTHDFGTEGVYTIRIRGEYDAIRFNNESDKSKIISLDQWGITAWKSMEQAFSGAHNLQVLATDIPELYAVTTMSNMFYGASLANPDTSNWNTSRVQSMRAMFSGANLANPDTSAWDTSVVTDMAYMFVNTNLANPDTSSWDTSSVKDMSYMFFWAKSANPDVSGWDVSSLRDASVMFKGVWRPFDDYDNLLIGWSAQKLKHNVVFGGGNAVYCSTAAIVARANLIASYNWTITDSGQGCPATPVTPSITPDLRLFSDTGISRSDNITANKSPTFDVICSSTSNTVSLYTNIPVLNTNIGNLPILCRSVGVVGLRSSVQLVDGTHNITYTNQHLGERSGHSPPLVVIIDTIAPAGPGSLTAPTSPINDVFAGLTGSCGTDSASGTVVVTTSATNGFSTLYNTPIILCTTRQSSSMLPAVLVLLTQIGVRVHLLYILNVVISLEIQQRWGLSDQFL